MIFRIFFEVFLFPGIWARARSSELLIVIVSSSSSLWFPCARLRFSPFLRFLFGVESSEAANDTRLPLRCWPWLASRCLFLGLRGQVRCQWSSRTVSPRASPSRAQSLQCHSPGRNTPLSLGLRPKACAASIFVRKPVSVAVSLAWSASPLAASSSVTWHWSVVCDLIGAPHLPQVSATRVFRTGSALWVVLMAASAPVDDAVHFPAALATVEELSVWTVPASRPEWMPPFDRKVQNLRHSFLVVLAASSFLRSSTLLARKRA